MCMWIAEQKLMAATGELSGVQTWLIRQIPDDWRDRYAQRQRASRQAKANVRALAAGRDPTPSAQPPGA